MSSQRDTPFRPKLGFILPALSFQLIWGWYPLAVAILLTFTNARARGAIEFTGLESYRRMAVDPLVRQSFGVTLTYTGLSLLLTALPPIIIAILLMELPKRLMRPMMLLWFLPISGLSNAVLWRYLFNPEYGLMQSLVTRLGLPPQPFLNSPSQVIFWLIFPNAILFAPGLIYLATLQTIPSAYFESAEVEGAGFWRKVWTITLPHLRPVILLMLVFQTIGTMQMFFWPFILTGGGPAGASRTTVIYLYNLWAGLRFADATVVAVYLFLVTAILVGVLWALLRERSE